MMNEILNDEQRAAIEIIVEEKTGYRDPEDRDGSLPDLEDQSVIGSGNAVEDAHTNVPLSFVRDGCSIGRKMQPEMRPTFRAERPDYVELPFFFREEFRGGGHRWVAWPGTTSGLQQLIWSTLQHFVGYVHVLLKLESQDPATEDERWNRFYGRCRIASVSAAIHAHEQVVLFDGGSQLCVRSDDGTEYFVVDDHGLFYVYSESNWFGDLCRTMRFRDEIRPLISAGGYWHYRPGAVQKHWNQFVRTLGLEAVDDAA